LSFQDFAILTLPEKMNSLPIGKFNRNPSVSSLVKTNKQDQAKVFIFLKLE